MLLEFAFFCFKFELSFVDVLLGVISAEDPDGKSSASMGACAVRADEGRLGVVDGEDEHVDISHGSGIAGLAARSAANERPSRHGSIVFCMVVGAGMTCCAATAGGTAAVRKLASQAVVGDTMAL